MNVAPFRLGSESRLPELDLNTLSLASIMQETFICFMMLENKASIRIFDSKSNEGNASTGHKKNSTLDESLASQGRNITSIELTIVTWNEQPKSLIIMIYMKQINICIQK